MYDNRLLIASNNAHKVNEFRRLLDDVLGPGMLRPYAIVTPRDIGLELEVEETGKTFLANARLKAQAFAAASGLLALADDSGIEVDALGGRPGVHSARYGGPELDDEGRMHLLLREMEGVPDAARACRYRVVLMLADPAGYHHVSVDGTCEGRLAHAPAGSNGFGYDPIFYIPEFGKTVAQLSPAEKDAISHRGQAARKMADVLRSLAGGDEGMGPGSGGAQARPTALQEERGSETNAPSPFDKLRANGEMARTNGEGMAPAHDEPHPVRGKEDPVRGEVDPVRGEVDPVRGEPVEPRRDASPSGPQPETNPPSPFDKLRANGERTAAPTEAPASLTDTLGRPVHDLRISVTDRCNFRCTYCMPAEIFGERYEFLPKNELLTYEEIERVARVFVELGVRKLRVTGGEPLVRQDVHKLIGMLASIDGIEDLTLTTNGYLLAQHADQLAQAGLRRITVSLDSLDPQVFGAMNGRGYGPERVLKGIEAAERAGLAPVKINTVVERGVNDHTLIDLARHFKGSGHILRFIEFMDVGNLNQWKLDKVVPSAELAQRINEVMPIEPIGRAYRGEVAERWRYVDGSGEIGFISSVTQPFCGDCTRVRLSPEGEVYTCLFATSGHDLRSPLRDGATDADLRERIAGIWRVRTDRYSELRASMTAKAGESPRRKVEMYHIGG